MLPRRTKKTTPISVQRHLALAAGKAGAADDRGADDVEEHRARTDRRPAAAEARRVEDCRDGRAEARRTTKTRVMMRRTGTPEISAALALLPTA